MTLLRFAACAYRTPFARALSVRGADTLRIAPRTFRSLVGRRLSSIVAETASPRASPRPPPKSIAYWLLTNAALTVGIISLGGLTRLTESGLSITEWRPVSGILPPLSHDQWHGEFDKYKLSPEYEKINRGMTLNEFKFIYLMEWAHRAWGRAIGLAYVLPAVYFWRRGYFASNPQLQRRVAALGGLIGLQGFLGWYMVSSGLDKELHKPGQVPRVSAYRLAAHFTGAIAFFSGALWTAYSVVDQRKATTDKSMFRISQLTGDALLQAKRLRVGAIGATTAVLLTAISGAFVAGLDAGLLYATYPKFADDWIPPVNELVSHHHSGTSQAEVWRNLFENPVTVQFDHRMLAQATYVGVLGLWWYARRLTRLGVVPRGVGVAATLLAGMATGQVALGIATLIYGVPIPIAAAHQLGSVAVLTHGLLLVRRLPK